MMYEDFLGKNKEYVEEQLHDKIAEKFERSEERIRYIIRENLSITFYFDQNKVDRVSFAYSEEVSPERVIEEIGYEFSECCKITKTAYRIMTPIGGKDITIYNFPTGTNAPLSSLE